VALCAADKEKLSICKPSSASVNCMDLSFSINHLPQSQCTVWFRKHWRLL
jgi:hypothetical protein